MFTHLPEGYKKLSTNDLFMILREDLSLDLHDIFLQLLSNYSSSKLVPLPGGRNNVFLLEMENNFHILIKIYSHGGVPRYFFPEYYFLSNRFLQEFQLYTHILKNKLPVPEYLGGFWIKKWGLYKCGVITRYIPNANTLEDFLNDVLISHREKNDILIRCGKVLRNMHDAGILHYDLQIRNVLIHMQDKSLFLIDFDKAKKMSSINLFHRSQNLLRLKRSFIKRGINSNFFNILMEGYGISNLSFYARLFSYPQIQWINIKSHLFKNKRKK